MELDPEMTSEQRNRVSSLAAQEISDIDGALRSAVSTSWRKMARVIGSAMMEPRVSHIKQVPDLYYAERLRKLVESGEIEALGDTYSMRYCEVRFSVESSKT